tara:strand:+ start:903 stop:1373 length:471 start_codon:yes stop_codon:yes gene_type:complete
MDIERQLIEIIATDRIDRPISSMSGKLKRAKPKLAQDVELDVGETFRGDRVYARVEENEIMKARGMREAIDVFGDKFPRYGKILNGLIEEKRAQREVNLYFGMYDGCRLTKEDYMGVMTGLGFTEITAEKLYPELMNISRNLARKRNETERSILIG